MKTLVFDIDKTLIYSVREKDLIDNQEAIENIQQSHTIQSWLNNEPSYVFLRPGM